MSVEGRTQDLLRPGQSSVFGVDRYYSARSICNLYTGEIACQRGILAQGYTCPGVYLPVKNGPEPDTRSSTSAAIAHATRIQRHA